MIEFKSDCGHTIRARDEDAGKKVRCSYCGREAEVPASNEDDIDFLFGELDRSEPFPRSKTSSRASKAPFSRRKRREFNPLDIALKLIYAAILITVIFVVTKKVILPYYNEAQDRVARNDGNPYAPPPPPPRRNDRPRRGGLAGLENRGGLYIASFPSVATAYYVDGETLSPGVRVADAKNSKHVQTDVQLTAPEGTYTIEVVLPWNAPSLTRYPGYNDELRRKIENAANESEKDRVVQDYFLPDGASDVFVAESEGQIYIVRRFDGVKTRPDRWTALHALFIPADLGAKQAITRFIPAVTNYTFNEDHVRAELAYYNVPAADRVFVLDALKRIGVMPYITVDPQTGVRRSRLFKIGIEDGMFAAPVLREMPPS